MATLSELLDQRLELEKQIEASYTDYGNGGGGPGPGIKTEYLQEQLDTLNGQIDVASWTTNASTNPSTAATVVSVPETDPEIRDKVLDQYTNPTLPPGSEQIYTTVEEKEGEILSTEGKLINTVSEINPNTISSTTSSIPGEVQTSKMDPALVNKAAEMNAVQGQIGEQSLIRDPVTGELSEEALVTFQQQELDKRATIQGQLSMLFEGAAEGEIPIWARPAVDLVDAQLSARGVSRSTIARDSLYNAIIGTALNIAGHDADSYKDAWLVNMETEYRVKMFNAANIANMEMKNADYAMQAQIHNAQAFLQMDFKNMDNEQRANEINMQARQQILLSNQSAMNAAAQFNAESENQIRQFNAQLAATLSMDNAARADAMAQFNETNSIDAQKYISSMNFQRDQFNAQMTAQIEQANVEWRREINTINTAGLNAVNQANATNLFNLSNQALTYLWQEARDNAYWAWMSAENEEERNTKLAMAALSNQAAKNKISSEAWAALGGFATQIAIAYMDND